MKILHALTYYHPHLSGLTIYVERLAETLAARGHEVTVVASRHLPELPRTERRRGVRVVRAPVLWRLHKGVVSPAFSAEAWRLLQSHDLLNLHLPLLEAGVLALLARRVARRPVVLTYHCDLQLPPGPASRPIEAAMTLMHRLAGQQANRVVTYTRDYAEHSPFVSRYLPKVETVYPPVIVGTPDAAAAALLRARLAPNGERVVGFAGRVATEKGIEYLLAALPMLQASVGPVRVAFAGPYEGVVGERYYEQLGPLIERHRDQLTFLGELHGPDLANFYAAIDCLVLPSVNSTESFGLVQVESMLCGTPVVASALPGVRQPVAVTGMGELAPIADAPGLAAALTAVLAHRDRYLRPRAEIAARFDLAATAAFYERLYGDVRCEMGAAPLSRPGAAPGPPAYSGIRGR
ncbi:MAG TPA: glycosyltransferase family 4 protein [Chloroflexota bacterium]|nr:glycosyltransferase family 4 protein [Chloroflexota bacterium]